MLASASPARLGLLRSAGLDPLVMATGVDEQAQPGESALRLVLRLAEDKARAAEGKGVPEGSLVVGCDSLLELDGETFGKPGTAQIARERWRRMRGEQGSLLTGHCVLDIASGRREAAVATTLVQFGTPSDAEIDAYVATGEPLGVAGAFTLDGRSAPYVASITGDPGNVIGLSLPLLRTLLAGLGVAIHELWAA